MRVDTEDDVGIPDTHNSNFSKRDFAANIRADNFLHDGITDFYYATDKRNWRLPRRVQLTADSELGFSTDAKSDGFFDSYWVSNHTGRTYIQFSLQNSAEDYNTIASGTTASVVGGVRQNNQLSSGPLESQVKAFIYAHGMVL